jgi:phosphatidate cytidylyltransferase
MKINKRVPTALALGAVFISLLFWSPDFFSILLSVFVAVGILEYYQLVGKELSKIQKIIGVVAGLAVNQLFYAYKSGYIDAALTSNVLSFFLIGAFFFTGLASPKGNKTKASITVLSGVFYLGFPFGLTYFLTRYPFTNTDEHTPQLLLGLVFLIWANDIFAYYAGSAWGKRKMLPSVSPKKTWEGFAGGFIGTMLTALVFAGMVDMLRIDQWLISAAIASVFGTIGDFAESFLKRRAGVKDSGSVFPGHGGVLDRFDAYLLAIPILVFYLYGSA